MSHFGSQGNKKGRMKVFVIILLCILLLVGVGVAVLSKKDSVSQEVTVSVDPSQAVLVDVSGESFDAVQPEQQLQEVMTESVSENIQEESQTEQSPEIMPGDIEQHVPASAGIETVQSISGTDLQDPMIEGVLTVAPSGEAQEVQGNETVEDVSTVAASETPVVQTGVFAVDDEDISNYAGVRSVNGYIEIKFAKEETFLPDGTRVMLGGAAQQGTRGRFVVMTTYRSPTLSEQEGTALAQQRAVNIKRILLALGVPEKQIIGLQPQLADSEDLLRPDRIDIRVETTADYTDEQIMVLNTD